MINNKDTFQDKEDEIYSPEYISYLQNGDNEVKVDDIPGLTSPQIISKISVK